MKMLMAVVPKNTADLVLNALINAGHTATYAETRGGMLRQSQLSLFIVAHDKDLDTILDIIKTNCRSQVSLTNKENKRDRILGTQPVTADLGGAVTFVWNIDQIEIY